LATKTHAHTKDRFISTCCGILRGPGGESIVDVVPGGTELELQFKRGVVQTAYAGYNAHTKCTGVYWA